MHGSQLFVIGYELPMKPIKLAFVSIFGAIQLTVQNHQYNKLVYHHSAFIFCCHNQNYFLILLNSLFPVPFPSSPPLPCSNFPAKARCRKNRPRKRCPITNCEAMNDSYENEFNNNDDHTNIPLDFIENHKSLNNKDQEDHDHDHDHDHCHDCDQEQESAGEVSDGGVGGPSPAEIKLKIKKSLLEFRCKIQDAILGNYLLGERDVALTKENLREVTLWGVPLLPSKGHEGTDIVLRKFLKAKDFRVNDAFEMLQKTMIWRIKNNIDKILDEDLGSDFENVGFLNSRDKEGRPVCYHLYEVYKEKGLYKKVFGTQEKCELFLRWRIQMMESAVKRLCFTGGVDGIIQVYDLKNAPFQGMKELHSISKKALLLFQNYYPEITYKNVSTLKFRLNSAEQTMKTAYSLYIIRKTKG